MEQQCRICTQQANRNMIPIFTERSTKLQMLISDVFNKLTGLNIVKDSLPNCICCSCLGHLENAFEFRTICIKSEEKLNRNHDSNECGEVDIKLDDDCDINHDDDHDINHDDGHDINHYDDHGINQDDDHGINQDDDHDINHDDDHDINHDDDHDSKSEIVDEDDKFDCDYTNDNFASDDELQSDASVDGNLFDSIAIEPKTYSFRNGTTKTIEPLFNQDDYFGSSKDILQDKPKKSRKLTNLCNICGKDFKTRRSLNHHINRHNNIKAYSCSYCDTKLCTSYSLKMHERIHTNEKPNICTYCGHTFRTSHNLLIHVRRHTKTLPYVCSIENCGKAYPASSELKLHVRSVHLNDRKFKCEVCEKTYVAKQHLQEHMLSHELTEKKFCCHLCNKSFLRKDALSRHLRCCHGISKRKKNVFAT